MTNIIGIDASLSSTGLCVFNLTENLIEDANKIVTKSKQLQGERLCIIRNSIEDIIKKYNVKVMVVEEPFTGKNKGTSNKLQRVVGNLECLAYQYGLEYIELPPKAVRSFLMDNGSASKEEVAEYIQKEFCESPIVKNLGELNDRACKSKNSDMYDAIAVAIAYRNSKNQ